MLIQPSLWLSEKKYPPPKHYVGRRINDLEDSNSEEIMTLRTIVLASTAVAAFSFGFSPQLLAQGANAQPGASTSQGASGGGARGARNTAASSTSGQANGGRAQNNGGRAQNDAGLKSEKTETSVKIGSNGGGTTIRDRSRTHVTVYSGGREDVILHRRRPHGMIVYNDDIIRHRPHGYVTYDNEPRRRIVVNERRPGISVSERTVTRTRMGADINVRGGERSRQTTGSASRMSPSQGSNAPKPSSGSQAGAETHAPGGNAGKQPSTTGQATH
jgi:hypothetical protein